MSPTLRDLFVAHLGRDGEAMERCAGDPSLGPEELLMVAKYVAIDDGRAVAIATALQKNPVMAILFVEAPEAWKHIDGLARTVLAAHALGSREPFQNPFDGVAEPWTWGDVWQAEAERLEAELAKKETVSKSTTPP